MENVASERAAGKATSPAQRFRRGARRHAGGVLTAAAAATACDAPAVVAPPARASTAEAAAAPATYTATPQPVAGTTPAACAATLAPATASLPNAGGATTFTLRLTGCASAPRLTAGESWLRLEVSGSGSVRTVRASAGPNASASQRNTSVTARTAAGTVLATSTVTQQGRTAVAPRVNPSRIDLRSVPAAISIELRCAASPCTWRLVEDASWVRLNQSVGSGSARVGGFVDANSGPARGATVTVLGHDGVAAGTVTITQQGPVVTVPVQVSPAAQQISKEYQRVTIAVRATECYNVRGVPAWMRLVGGAYRCGNSTIELYADRNTGRARTASLSVGQATATVTQLGTF